MTILGDGIIQKIETNKMLVICINLNSKLEDKSPTESKIYHVELMNWY